MSKGRDRTVYQRPDGTWVNKRNDSERATGLHKTQRDAVKQARQNLKNQGGGELTIQREDDSRFRKKDTVPPGNDPFPPRDTD